MRWGVWDLGCKTFLNIGSWDCGLAVKGLNPWNMGNDCCNYVYMPGDNVGTVAILQLATAYLVASVVYTRFHDGSPTTSLHAYV